VETENASTLSSTSARRGYQKPWFDWAPGPHRAFVRKIEKLNTKSPLPSSRRKTPRAALTNCRRLTSHIGVGLQAFGLAVTLPARAANPRRGRGGLSILGEFGARYRTGSHAQIFFRGGGGLIIFLEIKEFKRSCVCGRETSGVTASTWTGPCARSGSAEAALRGFIFRACLRAPGGVKRAHISAKLRNLFLLPEGATSQRFRGGC
jgi:hypothetical protein